MEKFTSTILQTSETAHRKKDNFWYSTFEQNPNDS